MNHSEFEQFLDYSRSLSTTSDSKKILSFIKWCDNKGMEEVIIRLSTDEKGMKYNGFFLDFTTSRIIASKKSLRRKFFDTGFVGGMAPLPYTILAKRKKVPDFKKGINFNPSETISKDRSNYYIWYAEVEELLLRKGVETTVTNMLGSVISANFLTIKTRDGGQHTYRLPVRKNGTFEKMYYWLKILLPGKVAAS